MPYLSSIVCEPSFRSNRGHLRFRSLDDKKAKNDKSPVVNPYKQKETLKPIQKILLLRQLEMARGAERRIKN